MLLKNTELFEHLNILSWHDAGYTGSRGVAATQEGWDVSRYNYKNLVTMGDATLLSESAHPINTAKCFFEIAPDRKLIQLPYKFSTTLTPTFFTTMYNTIHTLKVDIMWGAIISPMDGKILDPYLAQISETFNYYMNVCTDNGDCENKMLSSSYIQGIGSYYIDEATGAPTPIGSAAIRKNAITHVPTHLYIPYTNDSDYHNTANCRRFSGASCAAAILAGMMALVNDFFIDKTGYPLSNAGSRAFIRKYSIPVCHGFNLFRLPNPDEIQIEDFSDNHLYTIFDIANRASIPPESVDDILFALNMGYMNLDENGNFDATAPVTNEQLAQIIHRMLNHK